MPSRSMSVEDAIAGDDRRPDAGIGATTAATRLAVRGVQEVRDMAGSRIGRARRAAGDPGIGLDGAVVEPRGPALWYYDLAVRASVSRLTRASTCTSAEDATSSSDPSSARAARPALLSMSSAILVSRVCAAMIRQAVTGSP